MMELVKLSTNYPNPKSNDDLEILSSLWMDDLGHLSKEMFLKSIKLHRTTSKFFPTIADILDAYAEVVSNIPKPLALEEPRIPLTEEEEKERKKMVLKFRQKIVKNIR